MSKSAILILLMTGYSVVYGQDINITFSAKGSATSIDSVIATNLATGQSITLPGNETLVLTLVSAIPGNLNGKAGAIIYPNPFPGQSRLIYTAGNEETISLIIRNLSGQEIASITKEIQPGIQEFELSLNDAGFYWVDLVSVSNRVCYKIISTGGSAAGNNIRYAGWVSGNPVNPNFKTTDQYASKPDMKAAQSRFLLNILPGNLIQYQFFSGNLSTVTAQMPVASANLEATMEPCIDPDGMNYPIVQIGGQIWMAKNLAWLPSVSPFDRGSYTGMFLYVNGYVGSDIEEARKTDNYKTYGVLYNWPAAMNGESPSSQVPSGVQGICPDGWHLPSDGEWIVLERFLGMSEAEENIWGDRFSGKVGNQMKETGTVHWWSPNATATNSSSFTGIPGGQRDNDGIFGLGFATGFWSSTDYSQNYAIDRHLFINTEGTTRNAYPKSLGISVRCIRN